MKKYFFSLVAAMMAATASFSQSSMLATLSHDGEISTYYGSSALREAFTAADNGDIITLSSGSFNAVDITKAVTIRGAGMALDNTAQTEPTVITGDFKIEIPADVTSRFTLEGIYHNHTITFTANLNNGTFLKDRFKTISYSNASVNNLTMIHCKVASDLRIAANSSVSCVNCVIWNPCYGSDSTSNYEFVNSIVYKGNNWEQIKCSSLKNSILISTSTGYILSADNVVYNCVGTGSGASTLFNNMPNTTNKKSTYESLFTTFRGTYTDDETFELTDEAKTSFVGIDGTQVGIYGGNMPFSTTPTNPQITRCNVAAKSTADGKLSVDITVNGAE